MHLIIVHRDNITKRSPGLPRVTLELRGNTLDTARVDITERCFRLRIIYLLLTKD